VVLGCLGVRPGIAAASGFSATSVGTTLSGPATEDAAAVYWNPAFVGFSEGPTLLLGAALVAGEVEYRRERRALYQREDALDFALPVAPGDLDPGKTGVAALARSRQAAPVPAAFVTLPLGGGRIAVGVGAYLPLTAAVDFGSSGPQRWAVDRALLTTAELGGAVSVRLHPRLRLGAGLAYVLGYAELERVQDFAAVQPVASALAGPAIGQDNDFGAEAPPAVRELDVMARPIAIRDAFARAVTFRLGLAAELSPALRAGLAYHHGVTLHYVGSFELDMNDPFFTGDLAAKGLRYEPTVRGEASVSLPAPGSLHLGTRYQLGPALAFGASAAYTFWSALDAIDVRLRSAGLAQPEMGLPPSAAIALPRDWRDTVALSLAGDALCLRQLRCWGTLGYSSGASPERTVDVASPDGDRLSASLGAELDLGERWALALDAELERVLPRSVTRSDHDLGNGRYEMSILSVGLFARHRLGGGAPR
jgi:long-chain fatty acid transport protein